MNFHNETSAAAPVTAAVQQTPPSARAIRAAAIETFHDAAADDQLSSRLAVVGGSVAIALRGNPQDTFVLRMDDGAVAILDDDDPRADIRIDMDATDLHELFDGGLHLPMKIAHGDVTFRGQVRRFLRITAILRQMGGTYAEHLSEARANEGAAA